MVSSGDVQASNAAEVITSKPTIRKQAFYLVFESIVRQKSCGELILEREEVGIPTAQSVTELALKVDKMRAENEQIILENAKTKRIASIAKADLAILFVLLTEIKGGLDLPVALKEAAKLAEDFGGTDNSPKFIHAILVNAGKASKGKVE